LSLYETARTVAFFASLSTYSIKGLYIYIYKLQGCCNCQNIKECLDIPNQGSLQQFWQLQNEVTPVHWSYLTLVTNIEQQWFYGFCYDFSRYM
jgi:hypothetical protein